MDAPVPDFPWKVCFLLFPKISQVYANETTAFPETLKVNESKLLNHLANNSFNSVCGLIHLTACCCSPLLMTFTGVIHGGALPSAGLSHRYLPATSPSSIPPCWFHSLVILFPSFFLYFPPPSSPSLTLHDLCRFLFYCLFFSLFKTSCCRRNFSPLPFFVSSEIPVFLGLSRDLEI